MAEIRSTVPKADTPPPANNAKTTLISSDPSLYARPTAGGNVAPGAPEGGSGAAPAGATPYNPIYGGINSAGLQGSLSSAEADPAYMMVQKGADPSTGGTQVGPNFGHGATIIMAQPDATGHPEGDISGGGTVGNSGPGLGQ